MFETFALRLAAGLVFALLLLPTRAVAPRFYRIQCLIALALVAAAGMFAGDDAPAAFWVFLGLGGAAAIVGTWSWSIEGTPGGTGTLVFATLALAAALVSLSFRREASPFGHAVVWADDLAAAGLLGLATTAMLLGHWYLIAPTMSIDPLLRLLKGLFVATGLRLLVVGAALAPPLLGGPGFDRVAWLWAGPRWLAGLVGVAGLAWMAWQAARIRSTQSATGILYVVVIFAFLGELTDQLLHGHLDALAGGLS
jgi:hypothetical protein